MKLFSVTIGLIFIFTTALFPQEVSFIQTPVDLQLYPRDNLDSCSVTISGTIETPGVDSLIVEIYKGEAGNLWQRITSEIIYEDAVGSFSAAPKIHTELSEFWFKIYVDANQIAEVDSVVCGDVYLINGQSNARATDFEGLATHQNEFFRSFGSSAISQFNPDTTVFIPFTESSTDTIWRLAQGHTVHTNAAVGVWGLRLGVSLLETFGVPICIINGAIGASKIEEHLRDETNPTNLSTPYGRLLYRATKAKVKDRVKAILWHQGERNTDASYSDYIDNFDILYTAWKADYSDLEKIYIYQIHPGCNNNPFHREMREVQRVLPSFYEDVNIMSTVGLSEHDGCHYLFNGYNQMADWVFRLVSRDFYGSVDTSNITPPNILEAFYTTETQDEIILKFDQPVRWPDDSLGASMKDYFALDGVYQLLDSGNISPQNDSLIILQLPETGFATKITYLPNRFYHNTTITYEGPWIRNSRGIGALSFHDFPIDNNSYQSIDVSFEADWNMIGLPNIPLNRHYQSVFPGSIVNSLFGFNGSYVLLDTLEQNAGYWLRFSEQGFQSITGLRMDSAAISLNAGWNLISGISEDIPLSHVIDPGDIITPNTLFGFDNGYFLADTLKTGKSYWIQAQTSGEIELNVNETNPNNIDKRFGSTLQLERFPWLEFKDAAPKCRAQQLRFGVELENTDHKQYFAAPPFPPLGAFDVRFVSNQNSSDKKQYRISEGDEAFISIRSKFYPVKISAFNIPRLPGHQYTITELIDNQPYQTHILENAKTIELFNPRATMLKLNKIESSETPAFIVQQNYPNPFNPVTEIRYYLPHSETVSIVIFNSLGQKVKTLLKQRQDAGAYSLIWNATDDAGQKAGSGIYFYQFTAGHYSQIKKMLLLR